MSWNSDVWYIDPTLVELSFFDALPDDREVLLEWETVAEISNAGFNLYRFDMDEGGYIRLNEEIIPAKGSAVEGAYYEFVDDDVQNRQKYYYLLEDVDYSGTATQHGPVSATPRLLYGSGQ